MTPKPDESGTAPDFHCFVCGEETDTAPLVGRAVCQEHCEDHDYRYERDERGHMCIHCNKRREDDYGTEDGLD